MRASKALVLPITLRGNVCWGTLREICRGRKCYVANGLRFFWITPLGHTVLDRSVWLLRLLLGLQAMTSVPTLVLKTLLMPARLGVADWRRRRSLAQVHGPDRPLLY